MWRHSTQLTGDFAHVDDAVYCDATCTMRARPTATTALTSSSPPPTTMAQQVALANDDGRALMRATSAMTSTQQLQQLKHLTDGAVSPPVDAGDEHAASATRRSSASSVVDPLDQQRRLDATSDALNALRSKRKLVVDQLAMAAGMCVYMYV